MTSREQPASSQNKEGAASLSSEAGQTMDNSTYSQILASPVTLSYRLFSPTLSLMGGFLKSTKALLGQLLWLMVSRTTSDDLQGAITYCLISNVSQMSTAAASA